jgi:hypothetical protein
MARKNTTNVFESWMDGNRNIDNESIWTDGESIFSYSTCVLATYAGGIVLNVTNYSPTTNSHVRGILTLLRQTGLEKNLVLVDNLERGISRKGLTDEGGGKVVAKR